MEAQVGRMGPQEDQVPPKQSCSNQQQHKKLRLFNINGNENKIKKLALTSGTN